MLMAHLKCHTLTELNFGLPFQACGIVMHKGAFSKQQSTFNECACQPAMT